MADLKQLETWLAPLLAKMQAGERRKLARGIATALRRRQGQRIAAQKNPDGSPYTPRQPRLTPLRSKRGAIKQRGKMFGKIRQTKHLLLRADPTQASVEFVGRVARIARVHQEGLVDRVSPKGPRVRYPRRKLLGLSDTDKRMIKDCCSITLTTLACSCRSDTPAV